MRKADVEFFVEGTPLPKGSWKAVTKRYLKPSNEKLKDWQQKIQGTALKARQDFGMSEVTEGGVVFELTFFMPKPKRPKCAFCPCYYPDLDKLERTVFDACSKVLYRDDGQVVDSHPVKRWSSSFTPPGVFVKFWKVK